MLTYACFAFIAGYFAYNIPITYYYTKDPEPIKTDALKYDRTTRSYKE